jgi:hypothetical protein
MPRITLLYYPDEITTLYSLSPLVLSKHRGAFRFVREPGKALESPDSVIVLARLNKWRNTLDVKAFLRRLRDKFCRVVVFDDLADPREINSQWLEAADLYFKKQLLRDRELYFAPAYGKRYYTDYYHRVDGIEDTKEEILPALTLPEREKLRLSWNLGLGPYPRRRLVKAVGTRLERYFGEGFTRFVQRRIPASPPSGEKEPIVSARFGANFSRETVSHHRRLFLDAALSHPQFRTGRVALADYNKELRRAAVTLSPFGWGEVCFRDFEAVAHGSVLLKPSMEHIETWPDIYRNDETYVPARWDASDVTERAEELLESASLRQTLTGSASEAMAEAYRTLDQRVELFINQCTTG